MNQFTSGATASSATSLQSAGGAGTATAPTEFIPLWKRLGYASLEEWQAAGNPQTPKGLDVNAVAQPAPPATPADFGAPSGGNDTTPPPPAFTSSAAAAPAPDVTTGGAVEGTAPPTFAPAPQSGGGILDKALNTISNVPVSAIPGIGGGLTAVDMLAGELGIGNGETTVGNTYNVADQPSQFLGTETPQVVPGAPGRILGAGLSSATSPANILLSSVAGPEMLARGAISGAGSQAAKEVGAPEPIQEASGIAPFVTNPAEIAENPKSIVKPIFQTAASVLGGKGTAALGLGEQPGQIAGGFIPGVGEGLISNVVNGKVTEDGLQEAANVLRKQGVAEEDIQAALSAQRQAHGLPEPSATTPSSVVAGKPASTQTLLDQIDASGGVSKNKRVTVDQLRSAAENEGIDLSGVDTTKRQPIIDAINAAKNPYGENVPPEAQNLLQNTDENSLHVMAQQDTPMGRAAQDELTNRQWAAQFGNGAASVTSETPIPPPAAASESTTPPISPETQAAASRFEAKYNFGKGEVPPPEQQGLPGMGGNEPPIPPSLEVSAPGQPPPEPGTTHKPGLGANLAVPKIIGASMNVLHAAFRQSLPVLFEHPGIWFDNMKAGVKTFFAKDPALDKVFNEMAQKSGFAEPRMTMLDDGTLIFQKPLTEVLHINTDYQTPGFEASGQTGAIKTITNFGPVKRGKLSFDRILWGNANDVRNAYYDNAVKAGIKDPTQYAAYDHLAAVRAGYGDVPKNLKWLQEHFWSLSNTAARFQTVADPFTQKGALFKLGSGEQGMGIFSASPRGQAARALTRFAVGETAMMVGLGAAAQASGLPIKVHSNPLDSLYGRATYTDPKGNVYSFDLTGGWGTMVRSIARTTEWANAVANHQKPKYSPSQEWGRFAVNKLGPAPSAVVNSFLQNDPKGRDFGSGFAPKTSDWRSPKFWADYGTTMFTPFFVSSPLLPFIDGTLDPKNPADLTNASLQGISDWWTGVTGLYEPLGPQSNADTNLFPPGFIHGGGASSDNFFSGQ